MSLVAHLLTVKGAPLAGTLAAVGRYSGNSNLKVN